MGLALGLCYDLARVAMRGGGATVTPASGDMSYNRWTRHVKKQQLSLTISFAGVALRKLNKTAR